MHLLEYQNLQRVTIGMKLFLSWLDHSTFFFDHGNEADWEFGVWWKTELQVAPVCLSRHFHHKIFVHVTNCVYVELRFQMFLFLQARNKWMDFLFDIWLPFLSGREQKIWQPLFFGSCALETSDHCRDELYAAMLGNDVVRPNSLFKKACKVCKVNLQGSKMCLCLM